MSLNHSTKIKWLTRFFAIFWLIDGLLQFQTKLLSRHFISQLIKPLFLNDNQLLINLSHFFSNIFLLNPFLFGMIIGIIQIVIGLLIFGRRYRKLGLIFSIVWSIFIWIFGQNFGGLFNGQFNYLVGSPGPALIYLALSIIFLLDINKHRIKSSSLIIFSWVTLWLGQIFSVLLFSQSVIMGLKMTNNQSLPIKFYAFDHVLYPFVKNNINLWLFFILLISLILTFSILFKQNLKKITVYCAFIFYLFIFIFFQNFGNYSNGLMTDVGMLPLVILLGILFIDTDRLNIDFLSKLAKYLT